MSKAELQKTLDKIQEQSKQGAPNIINRVPAPPPPKEVEEVPQIGSVIKNFKARVQFIKLVEEDRKWALVEKEAKKERGKLTPQIKVLAGDHGISKVMVGDLRVNYFNAPREGLASSIPQTKAQLLKWGLTWEQIDSLFKMKDCYTLKISGGGKDEEDEG